MQTIQRFVPGALILPLLLISATVGASAEAANPSSHQTTAATRLSDRELVTRLASYLDGAAAEGFTGAVIVARGGYTLLERGYGQRIPGEDDPVRADTVFTTGSITKQFTAAAVLLLEQAGKLSVDDPIARHLPGVPADKSAITIHLLLSHQAGFPGAIGDDRERVGREEFVRRALATPLEFEPGTAYAYSNVGFSLAAAIVERVSGRPYENFLHEKLFLPAAMKDTGYSLPGWDPARVAHGVRDDGGDWGTIVEHAIADDGPGWHLLGNGGIHSTVGDMARWHRALSGNEILSDASKRKMHAHHADEGGGTWHGYGWSLEPTPWGELITHNGGNPFFFADFLRFLDSDVVVYYSTSSRDRRMHRLARPLARIVFTGEIPELEPAAAALAPPGSGEPAAAGSAAARWGLLGTAAGAGAGVLLDALAASDPAARTAFAAAGFSASVVADKGVDRLARLLERLRGDLGRFTVLGFATNPDGLMVALRPEGGPGPMKISLQVESEPPHRITGIGVQLGD